MDERECVAYASSNATDKVIETSIPKICLAAIESKYLMCHMTIQDGTQTSVKKIQVLHHVRYFKLYAYV